MTACGGNLIDGEISRNEQSPLCGVATIEAAAKHRYVDRNEAQPGRKRRPKIQWFRREQYYLQTTSLAAFTAFSTVKPNSLNRIA